MPKIFIINGPNLNLLGDREPEIYGHETLSDIESDCAKYASKMGFEIDFSQSNYEGYIIDQIQEARKHAQALVINAGAYTHTSVAIHDALRSMDQPKIELHLSNTHAREDFRKTSFISSAVDGVIMGFGAVGYIYAIDAAIGLIKSRR